MIELKGSYCYDGVKGSQKAVYEVKFKDADTALTHIMTKFDTERIVKDFWYGYHINGVNKVAKGKPADKRTEAEAYDKAEEILDGDFPDMTFERGIDKAQAITPEIREIDKLLKGKGLSMKQVTEMVAAYTSSLKE